MRHFAVQNQVITPKISTMKVFLWFGGVIGFLVLWFAYGLPITNNTGLPIWPYILVMVVILLLAVVLWRWNK